MEKHLEKKLRNRIILLGGICWKWVSPGTSGVPDRIIIIPIRKVIFVETKFGKNGLSVKQKAVQKILFKMGFTVVNIGSEEELDVFIKSL